MLTKNTPWLCLAKIKGAFNFRRRYHRHPSPSHQLRIRGLLDVDLPGGRCRRFGNHDAQDTILEAGLDCILVDTGREGEAAVKRSNRAFADPVLVLGLLPLCDIMLVGLLHNLSALVRGLSRLVLDTRLVRFDLLLLLTTLNSSGALTFLADVLVLPRDCQGVVVRPFDVDVLLLNTRELTVKLVGIFGLFDVELWCERADALELTVDVPESLAVVLVEETEDGCELLREAWEERHCCWSGCEGACDDLLGDAVELLWKSADCCSQSLHISVDDSCSDDDLRGLGDLYIYSSIVFRETT
jgi:hypothetical protein